MKKKAMVWSGNILRWTHWCDLRRNEWNYFNSAKKYIYVCDFLIILQKYNCNWDHWWCDVYDKTF
jgi:hypothetical protein